MMKSESFDDSDISDVRKRFIRLYSLTLNIIEMKKAIVLLGLITSFSMVSFAQTWQETWGNMTKEEKMMKMKSFRADNQKFLKDSLGMTDYQLKLIDSINKIYLGGISQIKSSTAPDDVKLQKARDITKHRSDELDVIMGVANHQRFTQYLYNKLQKAQG